jgi:hypothetical protein
VPKFSPIVQTGVLIGLAGTPNGIKSSHFEPKYSLFVSSGALFVLSGAPVKLTGAPIELECSLSV